MFYPGLIGLLGVAFEILPHLDAGLARAGDGGLGFGVGDDRFQIGEAVAPFLIAVAGDGAAAVSIAGSLALAGGLAGTFPLPGFSPAAWP